MKISDLVPPRYVLSGFLALVTVIGLSACNSKEKKPGQALVRVNGEEITVLQINDELKRAGVKTGQQEAMSKKMLESLIDRQLIIEEAMRNRLHRTPEVMQAIERAKAKIIEQAYLELVMAKTLKPSGAEIYDYFHQHPEYFAERKQYDLQQLIIASRDFKKDLKLAIDAAKSLEEVAAWLDKHKVAYSSGQLSRNTAELPVQMLEKLQKMHKGLIFSVTQGDSILLNSVSDVKDNPVSLKNAVPQIEQYLMNKKARETATAKIAQLRSMAKIQYLNASTPIAY